MRTRLAVIFVAALSGCASTDGVRYVYQDRDFGVIAMPENTDWWPTHYRRHGEKLMEDHFPDGHEVVRAEEVIEGERTMKTEGSNSAEVSPQISESLLKVVKFGHSASQSEAETTKVKECRIIYRRVGPPRAQGLRRDHHVDPGALCRSQCCRTAKGDRAATVEARSEGRAQKVRALVTSHSIPQSQETCPDRSRSARSIRIHAVRDGRRSGLAGLQLLEDLSQDEGPNRNDFLPGLQAAVDDHIIIFFLRDPDDSALERL